MVGKNQTQLNKAQKESKTKIEKVSINKDLHKGHFMPPEQILFYNVAMIGGFMGGYAMLRCLILGSAQTSNLINMVLVFLKGNYVQTLICIGSLILYGISTFLIRLMNDRLKKYSHLTCLFINAISIVIFALIPDGTNLILTLYPVYFMTAFMWNAFPGANGFVSAPIFSTNNYRQMVFGLTEYFEAKKFMPKESAPSEQDILAKKGLKRARFYLGTLTWFHIGVACAYFANSLLSNLGALLGLVLVLTALIQAILEFKHYGEPKEEVQILV